MAHKTNEEIEKEINKVKKLIKVGGVYAHYKNPRNHYKVIALATQESTDKLCVLYQAKYGKKLLFVRDVDSWLDNPLLDGKKVKRFKLVK